MPRTVLIIAGESSGELYGALLAGELGRRWPGLRIMGVGGERMREAGVEVFSGITSAMGLVEALSAFNRVKETFRKTVRVLEEVRPSIVVLIDYPDFNFKVAARARRMGIKVLYYVSPQLWAWRKGRIHKMKDLVDLVACVLPFEPAMYQDVGIEAEFVGHPVLDEMGRVELTREAARTLLGLGDRPYVAILPGSRASELTRLLPVLVEFARLFRERHPGFGMILPVAPNVNPDDYVPMFQALEASGVEITRQSALHALKASDAAVAASGTVTFQATLLGTPPVVIYRVSPITYHIMRMLVLVKYISITNLILGRPTLHELIQERVTPTEILGRLEPLLFDGPYRAGVLADLEHVRGMFASRSATARVATLVGEMAGW